MMCCYSTYAEELYCILLLERLAGEMPDPVLAQDLRADADEIQRASGRLIWGQA